MVRYDGTMLAAERGFRPIAITAVVLVAVAAVIDDSAVESLIDPGASAVIWPVLPLIQGAAVAVCVVPPIPELTRLNARRRPLDRLAAVTVYAGLSTALCVALWLRLGTDAALLVAIRSAALALGLGLCCAVWLSQRVSWMPVPLVTICVVMFGNEARGVAADWALIYRPMTLWTMALAAAVLIAGLGSFVMFGARSERGRQLVG